MSNKTNTKNLQATIADQFFTQNGQKNSKMLVGGGRSPRNFYPKKRKK